VGDGIDNEFAVTRMDYVRRRSNAAAIVSSAIPPGSGTGVRRNVRVEALGPLAMARIWPALLMSTALVGV
jgi:hypothetical protein